MSEPPIPMARLRNKVLMAGAGLLALAAILTGFAIWPRQDPHVSAPAVASDLRQARAHGRNGDWSRSARLIERHLGKRDPQAKLDYAMLLIRGRGVERDRERARQLLLQAVTYDFAGRGRAAFELGRLYKAATGEDCTRIALEWFTKAAQWDYAKAHLELGTAYRKGLGTRPDAARAMNHYETAATGGSAAAIWSMIKMVEIGTADMRPDLQRARLLAERYLPRLAAEAHGGNAYAARTIARLYLEGTVVARDRDKAGRWFTEAAGLGDPAAMHDLARLIMQAGNEAQDADSVLELLRESARRGYAGAMTAMGRLHLKERYGLAREEAVDWFKRGVAAAHGGAMEELARLHLDGDLVIRDPEEARRLARMGSKLGHRGSLRLLDDIKSRQDESSKTVDAAPSSKRG